MSRSRAADSADARLSDGRAWRALCRSLEQAAGRVLGEDVPDSPRDRAEGFRHLLRFLASGLASCVTHDDPDYPVFGRMIEYARPWGLDNPDCLYLYAPLRGGAVYRIWGERGTARYFDLQVNWGHFANGAISEWGTISSIDSLRLETETSGRFELWIGGEERPGNWLPSAENAGFILLRQLFYHWETERPADLLIERVGAPWPIPPPSPEWMADRVEKLCRWLEKGNALWEKMSQAYLSLPENSMVVHMPDETGARAGAGGQAYGMGNFHCEPGEAIVIELAVPHCHYWSVALANWWWECIEYASRQSSLNGAQARLDSDGMFRAVIAHEDPGVPNWLDPAGNTRGSLTARFVHAEGKPAVSFRRVPLEELARVLPGDTPKLTPDERARILERRRHAVLRRYRR
ncbi:MAG: hypothetical protein ACE5FG_07185 [Myxococcota bacterium]